MKKKILIFFQIILIVFIGIVLFKTQYHFDDVQKIALSFITEIQNGEMSKAYELTDHRNSIGNTFEEFSNLKDISAIKNKLGKIELQSISPMQTIGNRLKRIIKRMQIEPESVLLDYSISGIPLLIILKNKESKWSIVRVEIHAG